MPETVELEYIPSGASLRMFYAKDGEVLIDGPAGTGKTRGVLEYAHWCAEEYPGSRILFIRKTRSSLTESVLQIYEDHVLTQGHYLNVSPHRRHRQSYEYANGSMIVCGGLDNVDRIMSAEYDLVCLFEATEADLNDWEKLLTRLRNGKMPYQQAIADCNPSYPSHWLKARADKGEMKRLISRHCDNPTVTPEYLARLEKLSGHRYSRLYIGVWAAAEGLVYDIWDDAIHLLHRAQEWGRIVIGVDEGYTNPCSIGVYGVDGDDRVHRLEGWYATQKRQEFVVQRVQHYASHYDVEAVVVDPSAVQLMADLVEAGLPVVPANNSVWDGIQNAINFLTDPGDGRPRFTVEPGKENQSFVDEILSYLWKKNRDGSSKDQPEKKDDHAMDEFRYALKYIESSSGGWEAFAV